MHGHRCRWKPKQKQKQKHRGALIFPDSWQVLEFIGHNCLTIFSVTYEACSMLNALVQWPVTSDRVCCPMKYSYIFERAGHAAGIPMCQDSWLNAETFMCARQEPISLSVSIGGEWEKGSYASCH